MGCCGNGFGGGGCLWIIITDSHFVLLLWERKQLWQWLRQQLRQWLWKRLRLLLSVNTTGAYPSGYAPFFGFCREDSSLCIYKIRNKKQKFLRKFMQYGKRTIAILKEKVYDKNQ